ncbi:HTH-type transcriptional regulator MalT [Aliivibrio fischeri]|uniref:HTH-type transcriptional regulator MalT n=1 Tax=Aliivibrio fischeri TaxID=668 RepID=UPI00106058A5|nr:HTH-type transcriptional regulator MalT [Aliivibrio fischeri]TDM51652.1 HTH-type transcriptional regulator MalT [Aliivibrio fischeri]
MLIPSKLHFPRRLHNAILRQRVLDTLENAMHYKLVLFRSPAGYGKTTMAAQWLSDKDATGWYSLDESDNDEYKFAKYFVQTISNATHTELSHSIALTEKRQFASLSSLFSQVFTELISFQDEAYIVLDDYHLITNDIIHLGLKFFLKHLPDNLTLVITSRSQPPLNTANLRVRDLLIEIDNQSLAFDQSETSLFFNQRLNENIDQEAITHVREHVEGWPSALQLIALHSIQNNQSLNNSAQVMAQLNHAHLWDYLAEEVFDHLDQETQQFLMRCAVFDHFNTTLLSKVTLRKDAQLLIENLNRFGLFINTNGEQGDWYKFHNLFAEFLTHQRQNHLAHEEIDLQKYAAEAWLEQNNIYQALRHAKNAKDDILIANILTQHGWHLFNNGELTLLETTISDLRPEVLFTSPRLVIIRAWLAQSQHNYLQVDDLLSEAQREMADRNIVLDRHMQGEIDALRAQVAINKNEPEAALAFAEKALEELETNKYRSRIVATSVIGEYHHVSGNLAQALALMQQTEKMAMTYGIYHQALWAILQQSEILMAQGFMQAAFDLQDNGFKLIEDQDLHQLPLHEFLLRSRAQIYWFWFRFDEAEQCTWKGLDVLSPFDETKHLRGYSMLARLAVARGELDKAERYLDKCQQLLGQADYHIDWKANASSAQLFYWQAKNNSEAIQYWLAQADRPETRCNHFTQLQWRNIARAQFHLGDIDTAIETLQTSQAIAQQHKLITDINRNAILAAILLYENKQIDEAVEAMHLAIKQSNQTGIIGSFLMAGRNVLKPLGKLQQKGNVTELEKHRIEQLQKALSNNERSRSAHFDEAFIEKVLNTPEVPELIRTSPLTHREWQVLGLIYSGFSNEQIAAEFDVAPTTIKTHIRNLYQKLNLPNRKAAIAMADELVGMMK